MNSEPDNKPKLEKLTLEWSKGPGGRVGLIFDRPTWNVFEQIAKTRETTAEQMIIKAVAGCLGDIVEDNYVLNRFLGR